jgi:hypothetical protein
MKAKSTSKCKILSNQMHIALEMQRCSEMHEKYTLINSKEA